MSSGAIIEAFRRELGLTQEQFAHRLGLKAKGYISRIESGEQACSLRLALQIQALSDGRLKASDLVTPEDRELLRQAAAAEVTATP